MNIEHALSTLSIDDDQSAPRPPNITWETSHATDAANEKTLSRKLVPFSEPRTMQKLSWDLPPSIRTQIDQLAEQFGFTAKQAYSFRRGLLKCTMGMRPFMALNGNSDAKARLIAEAFEMCVYEYIRERIPAGVVITTEAQRKQRAQIAGAGPGPTPDITFEPPIRINDYEVAWIDCKMLYASYAFRNKNFMPESRLNTIVEKYSAAFGPGAFVFGNGFCRALEDEVPALFLDSTPLDMSRVDSVVENDQQYEAMTLKATRAALGVSTRPPEALRQAPLATVTPSNPVTPSAHRWGQIYCGTRGVMTYHYHVCTLCGVEGIRRKVSNKKAAIIPTVQTCVAIAN